MKATVFILPETICHKNYTVKSNQGIKKEGLLPMYFKTGKTVFKFAFFLQLIYFHESKVLDFD